jgi:hypothetical protein
MASDFSARRTILLDTGPLMTYLVLLFVKAATKPKAVRDALFRELRREPFIESTQERMSATFETYTLIATSQSVQEAFTTRKFSELKKIEAIYRRHACSEIENRIREVPCSIAELLKEGYGDLICRHGLPDAALLFAGAKYGCLVLTDEMPIFGALPPDPRYELRTLDEFLNSAQ